MFAGKTTPQTMSKNLKEVQVPKNWHHDSHVLQIGGDHENHSWASSIAVGVLAKDIPKTCIIGKANLGIILILTSYP